MPQDRSRSVLSAIGSSDCFLPDAYIELGIRSPVAKALALALDLAHRGISELVPDRAAHDAQTLDVASQIWVLLEQQANVRQRASRHQPCSARCSRNERAVHGLEVADVGGSGLDRLRQQRHPVQAALAMDVRRVHCIAHDGLCGAGVDLDIASAQCLQYSSRVEGGLIEGGVAVNGADA